MKNVVHCKKDKYDVYIGRPGPWGNPFAIGRDGTRDEVINKYRRWLHNRVQKGQIKIEALAELHGKVLGCWCAPQACHGDVLVNAAQWAKKQLEK